MTSEDCLHILVKERIHALKLSLCSRCSIAELAELIGALRVDVARVVHGKDKVASARHVVYLTTLIHDLLEAFDLDFVDAFIRPLLSVYSVKDLLLCQNVENGPDSLEVLGLIVLKEVGETPRPERVVAPDDEIGAFVDLGDRHCASALHIQIVDAEAEVMDHLILRQCLVKLWIHSLCL